MKNKVSAVPAALAIVVLGGIVTAPSAFATPHINEGVCPVYDETSHKEEFTGEQKTFTYTAPAGAVVTGWCSKAGSDKQGDGPYEVTGLNTATVVITHPSGKDLSHAVINWEYVVTTPPSDEEPVEHPQVNWIVDWPKFPTACNGVPIFPSSTEQVSYAGYGEYIAIYPQVGWTFVQDLTEPESDAIGAPHKNYIEVPISQLEDVCAEEPDVQEPPVVVIPPADQTSPPAGDVTPVTDTPEVSATLEVPAAEVAVPVAAETSDLPIESALLTNVGGENVNAAQSNTTVKRDHYVQTAVDKGSDQSVTALLAAALVGVLASGLTIRSKRRQAIKK